MQGFDDSSIEKLLQGVFDGEITPYDLPEDLYYAIADYLKKGLYKGFGGTLEDFELGSKDFELLVELRENVYMFSAAKTFSQLQEMSEILTRGDEIPGLKEFKEEAGGVFEKYNDVWLETEYNTAIGQAQNAEKWNQIEAEKDVLPVLRYSTAGSENVCEICLPLDGLTAPVDDPVWDAIMPENHFGCLCIVEQLEEGKTSENKDEIFEQVTEKMDDLFKMNPGKDKVIFSDEHPYFDVDKKDRGFAERNFGLPIPDEDE